MNSLMFPNLFETKCEPKTNSDIINHYHTPVTTGTSVLGIVFDNGVIIAADMLGSYGSLARFKDCPRIMNVNKNILVGAGGDYADFQHIEKLVKGKIIGEECLEDDIALKPASLHCWLTRVLYNRRSRVDPLWNNVVVAGLQDGKPFLGCVDKLGTAYQDEVLATGYGAYIAVPILRKATESRVLNREEAENVIVKCMEVLYYRDARSFNRDQLGIITPEGTEVKGPLEIKANWSISQMIGGYE